MEILTKLENMEAFIAAGREFALGTKETVPRKSFSRRTRKEAFLVFSVKASVTSSRREEEAML